MVSSVMMVFFAPYDKVGSTKENRETVKESGGFIRC